MVATNASAIPSRPDAFNGLWGSQGDGTFINPILPADFSDIDAIQAGSDYIAISSTLHMAPGMAILRSSDLVNWRMVGHAIADISGLDPLLSWQAMARYGRGVWAGAIRQHAGRFHIFFTTPDTGLFMTSAETAEGPWDTPHCLWNVPGYDDPCPFWDDDQAWLIMTRFAGDPEDPRQYTIFLYRMAPDGRSIDLDSAIPIERGPGAEASKLYRIGGLYYLFFSEVKAEGRVAMCKRATSLPGLAQAKKVQLNHVDPKRDKEPNQGAFLTARAGDWWFLTHQGTGDWEGRALCLLPVCWRDGWPIIGKVGLDGIGNMVWRSPEPAGAQLSPPPELSDDFSGPSLSPQWEWNHAPRDDAWSLTQRPGWLRLAAFAPTNEDFTGIGNILSQRAWRTRHNQVRVCLDYEGMVPGQRAGLCHMSREFASIEIEKTVHGQRLIVRTDETTSPLLDLPPSQEGRIWLSSSWSDAGVAGFSYSVDGQSFVPAGASFQLKWGHYRGDRIGLFTCNNARGDEGFADFGRFEYQIANQTGSAVPGPGEASRIEHVALS